MNDEYRKPAGSRPEPSPRNQTTADKNSPPIEWNAESRDSGDTRQNSRGSRRSRNRNDRRRNQRGGSRKRNYSTCPYCGQSVRDLLTAIATDDPDKPAHFDCVLKKIAENEELQKREKICYLGNGSFGIIKIRNSNGPVKFFVRKRIQFETKENDQLWRKKIAQRIKK